MLYMSLLLDRAAASFSPLLCTCRRTYIKLEQNATNQQFHGPEQALKHAKLQRKSLTGACIFHIARTLMG